MLKIKNFCILLIFSFILSGLPSCDSYVDVDKNYNGFSIGFSYEDEHKIDYLACAARGNQTQFNINNVTLDLFYGWYLQPPIYFSQTDIYEPVCVALYLIECLWKYEFDDYQNIENTRLLKEISIEEFSTEAFRVKMTKQRGKIFEQHSTFTIPQELFVEAIGSIDFVVVNIAWDQEKNIYHTCGIGFRRVYYHYIDEETVRLYRE